MDYDKIEVPRKLALAIVVLRDLPITNAKIVFAILMSAATGFYLVVVSALGFAVNQDLLNNWYLFLGGWATLGAVQYGVKHALYKPDSK